MELQEFIWRVLRYATALEEKDEKPNAVCVSAEQYKALEDDFRATFMPALRGVLTEPELCGLRVYVSDGLHGEDFFLGKVRTKTD